MRTAINTLQDYTWKDYRTFKDDGSISVGAMNGLFETDEDREGLARWQKWYDDKHGEGACEIYLEECRSRGTVLHECIEDTLEDKELRNVIPNKYEAVWKNYKELFLVDIKPISLEKIVYSPKLKFHGAIDCIGFYKGESAVIDFKFSSKPKDEEYLTGYRRQVAAYALILYSLTGYMVEKCVIGVGCDNGEVQVFKYDTRVLIKALLNSLKGIHYI